MENTNIPQGHQAIPANVWGNINSVLLASNVYAMEGVPFGREVPFDPDNIDHCKHLRMIFRLNYHRLVDFYSAGYIEPSITFIDDIIHKCCRYVAFLATMAIRVGYFDMGLGIANEHYSDLNLIILTYGEINDLFERISNDGQITIKDIDDGLALFPYVGNSGIIWEDELLKRIHVASMSSFATLAEFETLGVGLASHMLKPRDFIAGLFSEETANNNV